MPGGLEQGTAPVWFCPTAFPMDTDVLGDTSVPLVRLRCDEISISRSMSIPSRRCVFAKIFRW